MWEKSGCGSKRQHIDSYSDGNVLFLECSNVNILVLILNYSFTRSTVGGGAGNWVKGS